MPVEFNSAVGCAAADVSEGPPALARLSEKPAHAVVAVSDDAALARGVTPRTRGSGARLVAELSALTGGHGCLIEHRQRAWASVTFSGTRHELTLRFEGDAAITSGEHLIDVLPDHEFTIPRQLVAEAAIVAVDHILLPSPVMSVTCELLLLEDG